MVALLIGAHGLGTETTSDIETIAGVLREDTGHELRVVPVEDPYWKREWFKHSYLDLSYAPSVLPVRNEGRDRRDIDKWGGPFQIRVVASVHTGSDGLLVRGNSPIKTIYDLKPGVRFGVYRDYAIAYATLAWTGLYQGNLDRPETVKWSADIQLFNSWEASISSLGEGKTDVIFASAESPFVRKLAGSPPGIRFLELPADKDPDGAARFRRFMPFGGFYPAPRVGVKEVWGINTFSGTACMWCRPDFSFDLAYELTRWFDVSYDRYKNLGYKLAAYDRRAWRRALDVAMAPVHPGTIRYLKEIGIWTAADELRHEYNQKIMDWYCELWDTATAEAARQGIVVKHDNDRWIKLWEEQKKAAGIPGYRQMTDEDIRGGLTQMRDLGR